MKPNIGNLDRTIRAIAGILLIAAYALDGVAGALGIVALAAGIVVLGTATFRFCPPYALLGIDTCGKGKGGAARS